VAGTTESRGTARLTINGRRYGFVLGHDLSASATLAEVVRDRLGLTGLKVACDEGACGACTVIMDGRAVLSCMTLAVEAAGHDIVTIEGLAADDPVVQAFACQCEPGHGTALQCGFCTPGAVMTAKAFLGENPEPTLDEVREALAGNLCRCGCYQGISRAVLNAAATLRERRGAAQPVTAGRAEA
jgi:aerobic-type carbon monoxide dehydrogenase small subunit (CoxS/CutS family)